MFYGFIYRLLKILVPVFWRVKIVGREKIPEGAVILCGNHTHITDPVFVIIAAKKRDPIVILAKTETRKIPVVGWIIKKMGGVFVARDGSDVKSALAAMTALKSGKKLLIFPEGTRVAEGEYIEPKTGAAVMAHRLGAEIVPIHISRSKKLFSRVTVTVGEPYRIISDTRKPPPGFYEEQSWRIMDVIAGLAP